MAESHKFNCFAISEMFLSAKTSPGELMSILPSGYEMFIANRDSKLTGARGGGVALLFRKPFTLFSSHSHKFASFFQGSTVKFTLMYTACCFRVPST